MKRAAIFLVVLAMLAVPVFAEDDYIETIDNALPEEVRDILPDGFEDSGFSSEDISPNLFLTFVFRALSSAVPGAAKSLALMIGLLIISSVLGALRGTILSKGLGEAVEFLSVLCVCGAAFSMTGAIFDVAEGFISGIGAFLQVLMPILTVLSASSGNITFSAASGAVVTAAIALLDAVCASAAMPLLKFCFCMSVSTAMCGGIDLRGVSAAIKKLITYILAITGVALSAVLVFQTVITKSADSAAIKGIKFTVGTLIPFVGNAIGEAMTTVSGGIGVVKSAVGVAGAIILCAMVILPVVSLLVHKLFLDLAGGAASLLGLSREKDFLGEMSGIVGFLVAITAFVGTFFVIAVSVIAATEVNA